MSLELPSNKYKQWWVISFVFLLMPNIVKTLRKTDFSGTKTDMQQTLPKESEIRGRQQKNWQY